MKGFLGTNAGFAADLNLLLQIAMGVVLLACAWLARRKRFRAHGICAAAVMILNLFAIALAMWPVFHEQVWPKIPARLSGPHYGIAAAHGALGVVAELFGLYILLMAGTNILPRSWQLKRWKLWMRVELGLWWAVLATGIAIYFNWYVR